MLHCELEKNCNGTLKLSVSLSLSSSSSFGCKGRPKPPGHQGAPMFMGLSGGL